MSTGDKDGRATQAIDVAHDIKDAPHGILWERDALFVVVDGGLRRFKLDASGEKAAGPSDRTQAPRQGEPSRPRPCSWRLRPALYSYWTN